MDDLLLGTKTKEKLIEEITKVKELFEFLDVKVSSRTSHEPAREVKHPGFHWNAQEKALKVERKQKERIQRESDEFTKIPSIKEGLDESIWRAIVYSRGSETNTQTSENALTVDCLEERIWNGGRKSSRSQ